MKDLIKIDLEALKGSGKSSDCLCLLLFKISLNGKDESDFCRVENLLCLKRIWFTRCETI